MSEDTVTVFCTVPAKNGERVPLSLAKDTTPTKLRQQASEATGIPLSGLRVIFRGRMIKDDDATKVIDEYKLEADCVLHCIGNPVEKAAASSTTTTTSATATATATAAPSSFPSVAATTTTTTPAAAAAPAAPVDPLQAALQTLRSSNPPATYTTAVSTLEKVLGNIVKNPMEEKYRKVKKGNAAFQKRLGGLPGGDAAMKAVGFTVINDDGDDGGGAEVYQMQASADAWPKLMSDSAAVTAAVQEAKRASAAPAAPMMGVPPIGNNPMMPGGGGMPGGMPPMDPAMMRNAMAGMDPAMMRNTMAGMMSNPEALRNMLQNPMVQQMIQNDPNISPMHRNAMQQLAQNPAMLNQLSQMMQDPNMRAQMEAMAAAGGGMPGGGGGMGGMGGMMPPNMMGAGAGNAPAPQPGNAPPPRNDQDQTEEEMIAEAIRRSLEEQGGGS